VRGRRAKLADAGHTVEALDWAVGRLGTWVGQDFKRRLEKSEDTIRAWLDGVRGSDHGGAALELAFQEIIYTERAASDVLIEALSAGAYPNLHSLVKTQVASCRGARSGQPSFKPCETVLLVPGLYVS